MSPSRMGWARLIALSVALAAAGTARAEPAYRTWHPREWSAWVKELRAEEWYEESPFESVSDSQTCNATPRVLQPSNATPQPSNATPQPTPPCALTKKIDTIMCTEKMKGGKAVRAAAAGKSLLEWEYERRLHKKLRRAERKMRELREELRGWETEPCKDGFTRDWDDGKCHPMFEKRTVDEVSSTCATGYYRISERGTCRVKPPNAVFLHKPVATWEVHGQGFSERFRDFFYGS